MRFIYLITAVLATFLGMIICFGNVSKRTTYYFLFDANSASLVVPFFLMLGIGLLAGFFYGLAFMTKGKDDEEDDDTF